MDSRPHRVLPLVVAVAALTGTLLPAPAAAQTAAGLYERAQSAERDALAAATPSPDALRQTARAYEVLVRRYPVSGYADNALWQAAALLQRAFDQGAAAGDRDGAIRYFKWLRTEYPHSPLAKQAAARAAALVAVPAASSPPAAASSTPNAGAAPGSSVTPTPPAGAGRPVSVRSISRNVLPRGDRITIELTGEAPYSGERVANPDRIFFDFTNANAAAVLVERARAVQSPLIRTVRVGSPTQGVVRVVLELVGAPRFSTFPLYEPFRLVVDVESEAAPAPPPATVPPVSAAAPPRPAPPPGPAVQSPPPPAPAPPASTKAGDYSLARQLGLRVSRVVIDPGHGGHDPGAQANGVTEAELVLDVALRLEKLLTQQAGVEVVLTRRTNEFIPLEERTAIANREGADLFLSIHANAHRHTAVRGVETYFLNFATNPAAEAVAARENATSAQTMNTLPAIVKAIALNDKLAESREFASLLQTALVRRLRAQSSGVKDLGVKQAPFVVLIGAQMPSVLTEIAFLTNRPEAGLLKQSTYRQHIAQALRDSVVRYQDSLKKVTTVATRERER